MFSPRPFQQDFQEGTHCAHDWRMHYCFKIMDTNNETFLNGIGWDCYGCDYAIQLGDTLTFTMEPHLDQFYLKQPEVMDCKA